MNVNTEKFRELCVSLYDDENGVSEESHNLICDLLNEAGEPPITHVDATDGRFYLRSDESDFPSDYEACGTCGFDHEYEPNEANKVPHVYKPI